MAKTLKVSLLMTTHAAIFISTFFLVDGNRKKIWDDKMDLQPGGCFGQSEPLSYSIQVTGSSAVSCTLAHIYTGGFFAAVKKEPFLSSRAYTCTEEVQGPILASPGRAWKG